MAEDRRSDEELLHQLEQELGRLKVSDVLVQTVFTVSSLGYRKLAGDERDLEQARLAIEALRALVPLLHESVPKELMRDLNQVTANMQLAYAKAAAEAGTGPGGADAPAQDQDAGS